MNTIAMFSGFAGPYWMGVMKDYTRSYEAGFRGLVLLCLLAEGNDVCVDAATARPAPPAPAWQACAAGANANCG